MFQHSVVRGLFSLVLTGCLCTSAFAQKLELPKVESSKLTDTLYLITGKGGNIAASIGSDGTFLIDDKFPNMTGVILDAVKENGGDTPRFVINTHWHGDHTGGNINLAKQGSIIVAHDNVRKRLTEDKFLEAFNLKAPAQPKVALPVVTFADEITLHLNDDIIKATHIANAHTDGDSVIMFTNANILHAGDLFFNGFYPFIDTKHGGSLKGMALAADTMLGMIKDDTRIIPGHGPMATRKDLIAYRDMLKTAYKKLGALKEKGMSVQQAIAAKPLKSLDTQWGNGLFTADKWISIVYGKLD